MGWSHARAPEQTETKHGQKPGHGQTDSLKGEEVDEEEKKIVEAGDLWPTEWPVLRFYSA